ncbi:MAG TPA: diadenylate cyclase CdaA [Polyangiales bacterium]
MLSEIASRLIHFFARDVSLILWDLVDIGLVAVIVYFVLLLLKGTRAMQMGVGLVLVFVVYQSAKRLGLVTLYTMLDTLLTSLVLIIVVIFQQDIRRALVRFGRKPFFASAGGVTMEHQVIDDAVKAATSLAQKRIGALIVFEREGLLEDFIESGTLLEATVSKELLYSIFIPSHENPMHDGAVIIREGRIWQAGAFLPLTASTKLDRNLGTRHRAAIGLSEETDAVVIVVSEERGEVSLCFNGNIVRNLDAALLRKVLLGLFQKRPKRKTGKHDTGDKRDSKERLSRISTPPVAPSAPEVAGKPKESSGAQ